MQRKIPRLQRQLGLGGAATFGALTTSIAAATLWRHFTGNPSDSLYYFWLNLALNSILIGFFLFSSFSSTRVAKWSVPVLLFAYGIVNFVDDYYGSFTGFAITTVAILILVQYGFFRTHAKEKTTIIVVVHLIAVALQARLQTSFDSPAFTVILGVTVVVATVGLFYAVFLVVRDVAGSIELQQRILEHRVDERTVQLRESESRATAAAERAEGLAQERLVLLQEVQHRAKNSMQMAINLVDDIESLGREETINRLRAISLVYDLIDQSESYRAILLEDYLEQLFGYTQMGYRQRPLQIFYERPDTNHTTTLESTSNLGLLFQEILDTARRVSFSEEGGAVSIVEDDAGSDLVFTVDHAGASLNRHAQPTGHDTLLAAFVDRLGADVAIESSDVNRWTVRVPTSKLLATNESGAHAAAS